jgi:Carboxymuconolactone decarboxylase family
MSDEQPVLETLADITAASIDHNSLSARDFMLARLSALIAVDAPPMSYIANAEALTEAGLTLEDVQGVMIAVAPVVGTPRVMAAGGHILQALGMAIAVSEAEMADEADEADEGL